MSDKIPRRVFLRSTSAACMGGCLLLSGRGLASVTRMEDETIDPEKLCYCGYSCPEDCNLLEASVRNDPALKKEAYEQWDLEGRYGLSFDPEKIFCFRCKPGDQPEGPVLTHCTVRACAIDRGYQACIQCDELKDCDKDLWTRFPQFHEGILNMQEKYRDQV